MNQEEEPYIVTFLTGENGEVIVKKPDGPIPKGVVKSFEGFFAEVYRLKDLIEQRRAEAEEQKKAEDKDLPPDEGTDQ